MSSDQNRNEEIRSFRDQHPESSLDSEGHIVAQLSSACRPVTCRVLTAPLFDQAVLKRDLDGLGAIPGVQFVEHQRKQSALTAGDIHQWADIVRYLPRCTRQSG
jgi:hypothetical protein